LLLPTVSIQQFIALPHVHPTFFDLRLEIVSHQTNMITFDTDRNLAEVLIRASSNVGLWCSVAHDKASGLAQYDASRKLWQCLFRPRSSGYRKLDIFARTGISSESYGSAVVFGLDMPDMIQFKTFPLTYGIFSDNKCQIFEPLAGKLKRDTMVTIHCRIPGTRCVHLAFDGTLVSQEQTTINDFFKQQITVPKREVTVYVQFANSKKTNSYAGRVCNRNLKQNVFLHFVYASTVHIVHLVLVDKVYQSVRSTCFYDLKPKIDVHRFSSELNID
jgi:hypothetical protein